MKGELPGLGVEVAAGTRSGEGVVRAGRAERSRALAAVPCLSWALRRCPQPRAASADPPPSHSLPASAATARAQKSRLGQNSNLFPNE